MLARVKVFGCAMVLTSAGSLLHAQDDKPVSAIAPSAAAPADPSGATARTNDAEVLQLITLVSGSFHAPAKGEGTAQTPSLWYNAAEIRVKGLDNAVYFEIAREDSPANPVQQGVMQFMRVKGQMRVRMFGFQGTSGAPLVGMWTQPGDVAEVPLERLYSVMDVVLSNAESAGVARRGYWGATACPYASSRDGAVEATSRVSISERGLKFEDEGFDGSGKRVWGLSGAEAPEFVRATSPIMATRSPEGLIIIRLKAPEAGAEPVKEGGRIVVHYTGWFASGHEFDSSRRIEREPFEQWIPDARLVKGWNEGVKGIAKGERRRLVIPSELGFGVRGRPPLIPPSATLIFDIECLHVDNENLRPPAPDPELAAPAQPSNPPSRPQPTGSGH
jgi:hypothetical protein